MLGEYEKEQPVACKIINNQIKKNNISHAYIIETNNYYKGFDFALDFAKILLYPEKFNCDKITQSGENTLELEIIEPDGQWIRKEQLDELQKKFMTKSIFGNKVYLINHADKLNESSSNSILKFLEEPEPNIIAILVVENTINLFDTISSRCQIIKLANKKINLKLNTLQKIGLSLFNTEKEIEEFAISDETRELLENSFKFLKNIEEKGQTILKESVFCNKILKDKILFNQFLNVLVLVYKDCINYKIKGKIDYFDDDVQFISLISAKNTIEKLLKKISCLLQSQEKIKYNANLNLILDKLIIMLEGE